MTTHDHRGRRDRLRGRLGELGVDALYVTAPANVRYLSGFTGSYGQLLVAHDAGADVLFTDGRYTTQAGDQAPELTVDDRARDHLEHLGPALAAAEVGRLGVEPGHLSWGTAEKLVAALDAVALVALDDPIGPLRAVKDETEVALIRSACAITDAAFERVVGRVVPGRSEREIAWDLEVAFRELGADGPAFESIVASGPNTARPHHRPTDRLLAEGELLKLDFGARVEGYHADMTRTIAFGEPTAELLAVHELVVAAQAAAVAAALAGVEGQRVDAACREPIAAAGYGDRFVHGTGHGVGLQIHEEPFLGSEAAATLRVGMAVTVEPGIYLPGIGGVRIEDTIVVTDRAPDVLTTTPRDLLIL